jgi:Glycosyltransferase
LVATEARNKNLRVVSPLYPYITSMYNGEEKNKKLILSIGTNAPRKRPDVILKFLNSLSEEWTFVRIGDDLSLVGKINTKANYIYEKYVDPSKLLSYYNKASYLFFPSEREGIGLPMIEAIFHNVVVIGNKDNKIFNELKINDSISIQDINDPYIPDYPSTVSFFRIQNMVPGKNRGTIFRVKEELERIS